MKKIAIVLVSMFALTACSANRQDRSADMMKVQGSLRVRQGNTTVDQNDVTVVTN